jgi:hypothetical protein
VQRYRKGSWEHVRPNILEANQRCAADLESVDKELGSAEQKRLVHGDQRLRVSVLGASDAKSDGNTSKAVGKTWRQLRDHRMARHERNPMATPTKPWGRPDGNTETTDEAVG